MKPITTVEFKKIVANSDKPCVVKFKKRGCYMCENLVPVAKRISRQHRDRYRFFYVDVDDEPKALEFLESFGDGGVPSIFIYFKKDFQEIPWDGEYSYDYLDKYLQEYTEKK